MPAVRAWLVAEGLYDAALDSLRLPCNAGFDDFGIHAVVDGVLVSFRPFFFAADSGLHQRNVALRAADGFDALLEATARSTALWQDDLQSLFEQAKDRFPDVVWELTDDDEGQGTADEVWGHKGE